MKKLKFLLPLLAFVMAIGMSFAFVNATGEDYYDSGYILIGPKWYPVQVDCSDGDFECQVKIAGQSQVYTVYADENTSTPLESSTDEEQVIPDPR